jgi:hypothetical protein
LCFLTHWCICHCVFWPIGVFVIVFSDPLVYLSLCFLTHWCICHCVFWPIGEFVIVSSDPLVSLSLCFLTHWCICAFVVGCRGWSNSVLWFYIKQRSLARNGDRYSSALTKKWQLLHLNFWLAIFCNFVNVHTGAL